MRNLRIAVRIMGYDLTNLGRDFNFSGRVRHSPTQQSKGLKEISPGEDIFLVDEKGIPKKWKVLEEDMEGVTLENEEGNLKIIKWEVLKYE